MIEFHVFIEEDPTRKQCKTIGNALLKVAQEHCDEEFGGVRVVGMLEGQLQVYDESTDNYIGEEE